AGGWISCGIGVATGGALVGAIACTVASTAACTVPCCATAVPAKSGGGVGVWVASGEVVGTIVIPTSVGVASEVRWSHNCSPKKPAATATRIAANAVITIRLMRIILPPVQGEASGKQTEPLRSIALVGSVCGLAYFLGIST